MWEWVACFGFALFSVTRYDKCHYIYVSKQSQTFIIASASHLKLLCWFSKAFVAYQRYWLCGSLLQVFFFSQRASYFFSKLHPSSQIFHSLNRKKNALNKKYWSVSEKNGSQTFPLFFSWQICIWTLLTFLKRKINTCEERKRERKLWIIRSGTSFLFFSHYFKEKKNKRLTKKINLIFGNRRRQLQKNENKRKKCILVPRLIHSSYRL